MKTGTKNQTLKDTKLKTKDQITKIKNVEKNQTLKIIKSKTSKITARATASARAIKSVNHS